LGRIIKTGRGNGVVTETEFTGAHQVRQEKTTRDGKTVTEASYTYDSHNNLTQRTDTRPEAGAGGAPGGPVTTTTRYTYDAYNRLTGSEVSGADGKPLTATRYTLNVSGDVTRTETTPRAGGQAGQSEVTENSIDASGRLITRTITTGGNTTAHRQDFDAEGRLTTGHDGTRWSYDLHGRPVTMTTPDGTTVRSAYWADGSRAATTQTAPGQAPGEGGGGTDGSSPPEQTARFHYTPGGTLLNDTHTPAGGGSAGTGGQTTASYLLAGTRHARTLTGPGAQQAAATGAGYLLADRHGNTTVLTTSDGGEVSQAWQYTDYGQPADPGGTPVAPAGGQPPGPGGAARQPFTFAGEYTEARGTQYLKSRLYDTATGRFTTPDPAPRHNRYQAMGANPVNRIDPEGTTEIPDWGSYLLIGVTLAAAAVTFVITAAAAVTAAGPLGIGAGIALAGAFLDGASALLETVAMATGSSRPDDPLNIAALTLGAAGLLLGGGAAFIPARHLEYAEGYIRHSLRGLPVPYISKAQRNARSFPASTNPARAAGEEIVIARDTDAVPVYIRKGVSSRIHVSSTLQPLYRNDSRPPDEVFEEGFLPRAEGSGTSLLEYQSSNTASKFVGFSRSEEFASGWFYEYTYEIVGAPGGIVMNKTTHHPYYLNQREYVYPYGVRREFIRKVTARDGKEYFNPHFNPAALLSTDTDIPLGLTIN
ncbi:RHS repeat-associated core domain-containing protein, partial [Streptomyces sp. NPDC096030]|uniref:scabin-related ADP-ribosyltransferase n=1 Tax=Streptomyces sp. NPDC096030 TaxID=3155423 RepID=UPI00331A0D6E